MGGCGCTCSQASGAVEPAIPEPHPAHQHRSPQSPLGDKVAQLTANAVADSGGAQSLMRSAHSITANPKSRFADPIAEQVSDIVAHLWPRISNYASNMMVKELQPAILAALPSALKSAGVKFDREKNHLGNKPVEFRSIVFDKETQNSTEGPIQNLVITTHVEWCADLSLYLGVAGTGVGLSGLSFKGVLVIKLVRMLDQPPFYEGVRVFFNNLPEVDLEFQGAASALNLGFIRQQIVDTINSELSKVVLVPNAFGFALAPGVDIFKIMSPAAQGILHLTVWSADGLPAQDTDWWGRPSSDPYVKIACGAYKFKSPTAPKTLSPVFNFTVSVPIADVERQRIRLELFDEDVVTKDDFLGKVSVPVSKLVKSSIGETHSLLDENGDGGKNGTIKISASWRPLTLEQEVKSIDRPGMVFAGVYSATKLPPSKDGDKYWVSVSCDGIMKDASMELRETNHAKGTLPHAETAPDNSEVAQMKEKLEILARHNLSQEETLKVLGIQASQLPAEFKPLEHSKTSQMAVDLLKSSSNLASVEWNRSFEFPVSDVGGAVLSFDLMCQSGSGAPQKLGTYKCGMERIASCPSGTSVRTVTVPGTSVLLKLKLQLSFFEDQGATSRL